MARRGWPPVPALRPGTLVSAAVHGLIALALLLPVTEAVQSGLFDRHLVYLVPPDRVPDSKLETMGPMDAALAGSAGAAVEVPTEGLLAARPSAAAAPAAAALPGLGDLARATPLRTETALTEVEVDSAVVRDPTSAAPEYPPALLAAGVTGYAIVRYVVDTVGRVDTLSYSLVEATHPAFAEAVRRALPGMHFRPAIQRGRLVRQWVEQTFHFRIERKP
jgi:TonB family protein